MIESQKDLNDARNGLFAQLCDTAPVLGERVNRVVSQTYVDGALPKKFKYLLALAIALGTGCRICILAQLTGALEAGTKRDEILDVLSVVFAMKGTTGTAESLRVIQYLDEMGILT